MGSEGNSSSAAASPTGKRSRDPEDEVYIDNLHSHKRYLSEIMASSLNGLTVGGHIPENLMVDSPASSQHHYKTISWIFQICLLIKSDRAKLKRKISVYAALAVRDEMSLQYSPMSEDSDDCRYYETAANTCSPQPESRPTSPVSPYRNQRPLSGVSSSLPSTSYGCPSSPVTSSQPRQRNSDSEGRFPSSPSDICHSADLRRAALLRSVQMRTHPLVSSPFESPSSSVQDPMQNMETEDRPCSYIKSLDEREYHIEECLSIAESEKQEKSRETFKRQKEQ